MLYASGLTKAVAGRTVLSDINLGVGAGRALAVVGPNGSGKSTLLRAMALIDPPEEGIVSIDDQTFEFGSGKPQQIAGVWPNVTLVFQQLFLWPHLTLRENVLLPIRSRGKNGLKESSARCDELAEELSVLHLLHRLPNEVSHGERQRVAVLRSLMLRPKYLLLDEVTSALDVEQMERMLQVLLKAKRSGTGIIFVSHFLGFVRKLADEFLFMDNGVVVERGALEAFANPSSERMRRFLSFSEVGAPDAATLPSSRSAMALVAVT